MSRNFTEVDTYRRKISVYKIFLLVFPSHDLIYNPLEPSSRIETKPCRSRKETRNHRDEIDTISWDRLHSWMTLWRLKSQKPPSPGIEWTKTQWVSGRTRTVCPPLLFTNYWTFFNWCHQLVYKEPPPDWVIQSLLNIV